MIDISKKKTTKMVATKSEQGKDNRGGPTMMRMSMTLRTKQVVQN